ncbi:MAG: acyltransferase, partial [Candidatus Margulisiibacteriota bacterium]
MIVSISNPLIQTYLFSAILILALVLSLRKKQTTDFFGINVSQELKGLAILTIVFAHVTYALVDDTKFLAPLASLAGVGVNLFLILSGYGLTASALKKPLSIGQFYKRRLLNLYFPFWVCLIAFFALDYFLLHLNYGLVYMVKAFFGLFTHADLYQDVNAPFWYFSWIVMYYLLFPLLYIKKVPWLSAILMYILPFALLQAQPHFLDQIIHLYRVHVIAFPLGMIMGWFFNSSAAWPKIKNSVSKIGNRNFWHFGSVLVLLLAIYYFYKNSGVGEINIIEETVSIIACLLFITLFIIKRIEIKALYWVGVFSYEIYMFHWPLMYRYDFLFKYTP